MITHARHTKIIGWIARAVELQLFLSLVSLPVLIAWGLPFSLVTIASNLIFGPMLSIFLLISSVIFFLELLSLPNGLLIGCLEYVTGFWRWVLSWHQPLWLVGFAKPHLFFLCVTVICAFCVASRTSWSYRQRVGTYLIMFISLWIVCGWYSAPVCPMYHVPVNNGSVIVIRHAGTTIVIDPGYIAQRPSAQSWLQYTFVSWLISTTGSLVIDHLILLQPGSRIFEAVTTVCPKARIKNIYVPWGQGDMSCSAHRNFCLMKEAVEQQGGKLKRCGSFTVKIPISPDAYLKLVPLGVIKVADYCYHDVGVECSIDKEMVAFYAAKHVDT